jgi:enoyl-CoA hydratase/carnithine racemase
MTADSSDKFIEYEVCGAIAVIRLARPPVNALGLAMVRRLIAALEQAAADDAVRAVVLASAVDKRFCAGLDIASLVGQSPDQIRTLVHALYVELFEANIGSASLRSRRSMAPHAAAA